MNESAYDPPKESRLADIERYAQKKELHPFVLVAIGWLDKSSDQLRVSPWSLECDVEQSASAGDKWLKRR